MTKQTGEFWTLIPDYIYSFEELKPSDRELFGAIKGLTSTYGYCNASTKFLADRIRVSERTVTRSIGLLKKLHLIRVETERFNGATKKRKVFVREVDLAMDIGASDGQSVKPAMANLSKNDGQSGAVQGDLQGDLTKRARPQKKQSPPGYRDGCIPIPQYENVYMTEAEIKKLETQFEIEDVDAKVASLDSYIENGVKKYVAFKNHYKTLLGWLKSGALAKAEKQTLEEERRAHWNSNRHQS